MGIYNMLVSYILISTSVLWVLSGAATPAPATVCDQGWIPYNNWCYLYHAGRPVQWKAAQGECNTHDASLIRFYSQADIDWAVSTAKKYKAMGYWTAMNDNPKIPAIRFGTGRWKWGTNENINMSLIQWSSSPTNDGVSNCAGINMQGKVSDTICSAKQGYICSLLKTDGGCPLGWLAQFDYQCYWVSNTTDKSQLLTWSAAKTWCMNKAQGASLLIMNNASDLNFIQQQLPYLVQDTKLHWIGLTNTAGQWGWYNKAPYINNLISWAKEPDNVAGVENCGVLRRTGKFSDRDCTTGSSYICMKPQYNAITSNNLGCGTWLRAGTQCYGFMRNMAMTWQNARNYCQKYGGDLMKVDTLDKQSWIQEQFLDPGNDKVFWTGLNDIATEGRYVWADGSLVNQTYINWNQEPNDFKGKEDCALIYNNGQYNDIICTSHAAAICEIAGTNLDTVESKTIQLSSCPDNTWVTDGNNGNSCYLFTPYNNVTVLFTNLEASAYCSRFATTATNVGALLSVSDATEKAFIKGVVATMADNAYGWWTSLNDKQTEGFWMFGDGTDPAGLVDWNGEPSTAPNDDCGLIQYAGAFHQRDCSRKLHFICERYSVGYSGSPVTKVGNLLLLCAVLSSILFK